MRQHQELLNKNDIDVKVIAFDDDFMAKAYVQSSKMPWPLLLDHNRELYTEYGMLYGSWWDIYNPFSVWNYLKLIISGKGPGKPGRDWRQLGGDILIDAEGIIRLHYVSSDPHDRPPVESLLEITSR